jgi:hypothetical protein
MRFVQRLIWLTVLAALALSAAPLKLYLKSGSDMLVREYELKEDRVRYYSIERSQWEEIPVRLVDFEKTAAESARQTERLESMRAESAAERGAERKARTELHNVPIDDGLYWYKNDQATAVPQNDLIEEKSGKRKLLRAISPIPVIAGKRKLLLEGPSSEFAVDETAPIFFIRDTSITYFGIVKLAPEKDQRLVQIIQNAGPENQLFEEQEEVEVFRQQLASGVYRVWPTEPLPAGEYAFIDFTPGEADLRVWSFSVKPAAGN